MSSPPCPTFREDDPQPPPDLTSKSVGYDFSMIKREDASATKNDPIDLTNGERDCLAPAMTEEEKKLLRQITNNLMKTKTSRHFQEPVKDNPKYFMAIKEPMDLKTLKRKLIDGDYASRQEYQRDFRLIIDNALQFHEPDSEIAKDARSLSARFEEKMTMLSLTDMEELEYMSYLPEYKSTSSSSRPASPASGANLEPPTRTRELRPRAAGRSVHTYPSPSLRELFSDIYRKDSKPDHP